MVSAVAFVLLLFPPTESTGQELVNASFQKLLKATSVSLTLKVPKQGDKMSFSIRRGGFVRMSISSPGDEMEIIVTPSQSLMLMPKLKQYMKMPAGLNTLTDIPFPGLEAFSKGGKPPKAKGDALLTTVEGRKAYRVSITPNQSAGMPSEMILFLDPKTGLPIGASASGQTAIYDDLQIDKVDESTFKWDPPSDWKSTEGMGSVQMGSPQSEDQSLLKVGAVAPDFVAKDVTGKTTSLKAQLRGHKALLLNFWFYG